MPDFAIIFVYGSLKQGYELNGELRDQEFLGNAITRPKYRLFDIGSYPGLIRASDGGIAVKGEVYRVSPNCLRRLDEIEGVEEGYYERRRIALQTPFESRDVWAYFYLRSVSNLRDCGPHWP